MPDGEEPDRFARIAGQKQTSVTQLVSFHANPAAKQVHFWRLIPVRAALTGAQKDYSFRKYAESMVISPQWASG